MNYKIVANNIRKKILDMAFSSQESHIGSALSIADILTVLYSGVLKVTPKNYLDDNRDKFILSKGHAVMALYATLAEKKFFFEKEIVNYCKDGFKMPGHSTRRAVPGMEVSTGSLGHGLPMAVGIALANKRDKNNNRVFVLMSDGECDEGTTWESALISAHHKLDNLMVIIDYNKLQALGRTNEVLGLEPFAKKWESFGWSVKEINGHNYSEIEKALRHIPFKINKPNLIIAHTVKGRGVSFMEDKLEWHYKHLDKDHYGQALKEIK